MMENPEEFHLNPYLVWQKEQGIPAYSGFFIEDLRLLKLDFWKQRNVYGAFVNLSNSQVNDTYVLEIPQGGRTYPRRQLFDELIMVVSGQGATCLWYEESRKISFEWQQGSIFAIPPNTWHEHYAAGSPARFVAATSAPLYMQLFNNNDFIFSNEYRFKERYAEEEGYFKESIATRPGLDGIETNFIADVRQFFTRENVKKIQDSQNLPQPSRGPDMFGIRLRFARSMMTALLSGWAPGTYKKAHRHGPGYYIVILGGVGYSSMWQEGTEPQRIDWHEYSMFVPPMMWFHQHFNVSSQPTRFLAFRPPGLLGAPGWSGEGERPSVSKGRDQIEFYDEGPEVRHTFEKELSKTGLKNEMPPDIYVHPGTR